MAAAEQQRAGGERAERAERGSDNPRGLSLAEWLVLALVCEEPTYGRVVAGLLDRHGSVGRIWTVSKATVYLALKRLEQAGLIRAAGRPPPRRGGPERSLVAATPAGRAATRAWLSLPVADAGDVRSELMVKLALLDRAGADPRDLVQAQLARLRPAAAALDGQLRAATGFERTLVLWRCQTMTAAMRFLKTLTACGPGDPVTEGDHYSQPLAEVTMGLPARPREVTM